MGDQCYRLTKGIPLRKPKVDQGDDSDSQMVLPLSDSNANWMQSHSDGNAKGGNGMQQDLTNERLRGLLGDWIDPMVPITDKTTLGELGFDSLDLAAIWIEIEKEFDIDNPDQLVNETTTVLELTNIINQLRKEKTGPVTNPITVIVNGKPHKIEKDDRAISFGDLCQLSGIPADKYPTITWRNGRVGGVISPGAEGPLGIGIVYNVFLTGNA